MAQSGEKEDDGPPPSVIRRAQLPPPSEVEDEEVYMVTFRSGNTVPMLGRELKDTLTTDRPPGMSQSQDGSSGSGSDRKWWQDVLLGIGRISGIFLRDRLGNGEELSQEEREALRRIAEQRRQEQQRQQRRNRWLLIGGVVVLGGLGIWMATRSSSASSPPPPPPPEPEPEPQEPEEVEITDVERENEGDPGNSSVEDTPSDGSDSGPPDLDSDTSA